MYIAPGPALRATLQTPLKFSVDVVSLYLVISAALDMDQWKRKKA